MGTFCTQVNNAISKHKTLRFFVRLFVKRPEETLKTASVSFSGTVWIKKSAFRYVHAINYGSTSLVINIT